MASELSVTGSSAAGMDGVEQDSSEDTSLSLQELFRRQVLSPTVVSPTMSSPFVLRSKDSGSPDSDEQQSPKRKSPANIETAELAGSADSGLELHLGIEEQAPESMPASQPAAVKKKKFNFGALTLDVPEIVLKPVVQKPAVLEPYDPEIRFCLPREARVSQRTMGVFHKAAKAVSLCETEQDPTKVARMLPHKTSNSGVNGSYFIRGQNGQRLAVFKPLIGEQFSEAGDGGLFDTQHVRLKDGIEKGGSCSRECAAYYLGASAGVPPTAEITLRCGEVFTTTFGSKTYENLRGSAQMFVPGRSLAEKPKRRPARIQRIAPRLPIEEQLKQISVQDHHRLFLFDLRTVNTDRHKGNLFITPDNHFALIDNGCILAGFGDNLHYCWMDWAEFIPALHEPFDREMIEELDWRRDAIVIKKRYPDFSDTGIETLRLSEFVLKAGSRANLTPYEIGHFYEQSLNEQRWMISPMNCLYGAIQKATQDQPADFLPTLERAISIAVQAFPKIRDHARAELDPGKKLDYNDVWMQAVQVATEQVKVGY